MVRGLYNWTFHDIVRFLKEHDFRHNHTEGSHYYYVGDYGGKFRQVHIPFHGSKTIKPRTLKGIIVQSGIPKEKWLPKK